MKLAKTLARGNDYAKIFNIPNGQVLIEMDYPEVMGEPYFLVQSTMLGGKIKAKITSNYISESLMLAAFNDYDEAKAIKFNEDAQKLI